MRSKLSVWTSAVTSNVKRDVHTRDNFGIKVNLVLKQDLINIYIKCGILV